MISYIMLAIVLGFVIIVAYRLYYMQLQINEKLDKVIDHLNIETEVKLVDDEVFLNLMKEKKWSKAIRHHRMVTGVSLVDAKNYVEQHPFYEK